MKKRIICMVLMAALVLAGVPVYAADAAFSDVPAGSWAEGYITEAVDLGIIGGYSPEVFGYGDEVTRAQFAAMLVRLFKWEKITPDTPAFADNTERPSGFTQRLKPLLPMERFSGKLLNSDLRHPSPGKRWQ